MEKSKCSLLKQDLFSFWSGQRAAAMAFKRALAAQGQIDAEPDGKKARLQRMLNIGSTSNKALAKITREAGIQVSQDHDTVEVGQARFSTLSRSLQVPGVSGRLVDWEFCDPGLLVSRVVWESAALRELSSSALTRTPCSHSRPWKLLTRSWKQAQGREQAEVHELGVLFR